MKLTRIELDFIPEKRRGYILPIEEKVEIFQGYNGPYSHFALKRGKVERLDDGRFGIDFDVLPGTKVVAAKEGIVYGLIDFSEQYYEGLDLEKGLSTPANFVLLKHNDNSFTLYSHLVGESINLEYGERVEQGQLIARTGMSGWVGTTPHLHFEALEISGGKRLSFPTLFDNYFGVLEHSELNLEKRCEN